MELKELLRGGQFLVKESPCDSIFTPEDFSENGIVSFVEGDEQSIMLMGLKRFTKYSHYPNVAALRGNIADKVNKENAYCF